MIIANWIALMLVLTGAFNWGLVGIFQFNLVEWITMGFNGWSIAIYILVLLAAIWLIISLIMARGALIFCSSYENRKNSK